MKMRFGWEFAFWAAFVCLGAAMEAGVIPAGPWMKVAMAVLVVLKTATSMFGQPIMAPGEVKPPSGPEKGSAAVGAMAAIGVTAAVAFLLLALSTLAGCAGVRAATYTALATQVSAAEAARDSLPAACEVGELRALNAAHAAGKPFEQAYLDFHAVHEQCLKALAGLDSSVAAGRGARDLVRDANDALTKPTDLGGYVHAAYNAYANARLLVDALRGLGVNVSLPEVK